MKRFCQFDDCCICVECEERFKCLTGTHFPLYPLDTATANYILDACIDLFIKELPRKILDDYENEINEQAKYMSANKWYSWVHSKELKQLRKDIQRILENN